MIKFFFYNLYLFFYDIFFLIQSVSSKKNFIILFPRIISLIIKKVLIFDKKNFSFFFQYIRNNYDLLTVHEIFQKEDYNLKTFKIWSSINEHYIRNVKNKNRPLIIDCGSNIGSSSNYFSKIFCDAFIVSIEPEINNFLMIKKNFPEINSDLLNKAVSSDNKNYFIKTSFDPRAHYVSNNTDEQTINSITIEEILDKYKKNIFTPFLIKIDIEGFEENLFSENFKWIDKFLIIIIEIHDWMIPNKANSYNFVKALNQISTEAKKRDLIISGENLISIRNL
jgi:FkbM family methyltransferase